MTRLETAMGWLSWLVIAVTVVVLAGAVWWFVTMPPPRTLAVNATPQDQPFSYEPYAQTLELHVNERGMVDYRALQSDPVTLEEFVSRMQKLDQAEYEKWDDAQKVAFWSNAYNALTLLAIIRHYPIDRSSQPMGLLYPANSIRQIPGVWDRLRFVVMGRERTLNEIEHEILRKQFDEPRIHMALVCAALGCPPLRDEPFVGPKLDEQLNDQSKRFMSDVNKFRIDRENGVVHLSSIFKWFGGDFVKRYATDEGFAGHSPEQRAVLNFVSRHVSPDDAEYLRRGRYRIEYLPYDWSLNEQT